MDVKKIVIILISFLVFVNLLNFAFHRNQNKIITKNETFIVRPEVLTIPIIKDSNPYTASLNFGTPIPERDEKYKKYLSASVQIVVSENGSLNNFGSGTIIHYDRKTKLAYIASCGHLWEDGKSNKTAVELKKSPKICKIIVWYHNSKKLDMPITYPAKVLFYSNVDGYDCSLLSFAPDWTPNFFPIAKTDYEFKTGQELNSLGCDQATEVARYGVVFSEIGAVKNKKIYEVITLGNSPRPGRSGGGLISEDGYYVGTCWGTSELDGSGKGYFTSLKSIHEVYIKNGYEWILNYKDIQAKRIPIINKSKNLDNYEKDYISSPDDNTGIIVP